MWNIEMEALFELADLSGKRHRIGGFAIKHLDGNGAAIRSAEQTVDNSQADLANRRGRTSTDCAARTAATWAAAGLRRRRPRAEHDRGRRE